MTRTGRGPFNLAAPLAVEAYGGDELEVERSRVRNRSRAIWLLIFGLGLSGCPGDAGPDPRSEAVEPTGEPDPTQPEVKPDFRLTRECRLPTIQDIQEDDVVQWAFRDRLRESFVGKERGNLLEEGGWIYQCQTTAPDGSTAYYLDVTMVRDPEREGPSISMHEQDHLPHMPGRPECRTVGQFHTHLHSGSSQREPSGRDKENLKRRGVPSFIVVPTEEPQGYPIGGGAPVAYERLPPHEPIPYGDWGEPGKGNLSWSCDPAGPARAADAYEEVSLVSCGRWQATIQGQAIGGSLSLSGTDVNVRQDTSSGMWSASLFSPQAYSITENVVGLRGDTYETQSRPVSGHGVGIRISWMTFGDFPGRPKGEQLFEVYFDETTVFHSLIVPNDGGPSPTGSLQVLPTSSSRASGRFESSLLPRSQLLYSDALVRPPELLPEVQANEARLTGTFEACL